MIEAQNVKRVLAIAPKAVTAGESVTGKVDCKGYDYATIEVLLDPTTTTNGTSVITFKDSDDNTTFVTIAANQTVTAGTNDGVVVCHVDMRGKGRYLEVGVTQNTTTNTTGVVAAMMNLSKPHESPQSTVTTIGGVVGATVASAVVIVE
jgi:hypothetical protein